ncbi:MAG: hypothetical protein ACI31F_00190, partial [Muribaculaceae bacterium]
CVNYLNIFFEGQSVKLPNARSAYCCHYFLLVDIEAASAFHDFLEGNLLSFVLIRHKVGI